MTKHSISNIFYRIFTALIVLALILTLAPPLVVRAAAVRYVIPAGLTSGTCGSWANGCELQYALGIATSGDELWVKQGTYKPTSGSDRAATFTLKNGVGVYGGFGGTETLRTQRDWISRVTTLSGDLGTIGNSSDNSYHVVKGSLTNNTAVLDGFTITGGKANFSPTSVDGAGMYNLGGSPRLANLIFSGNSADNDGGGMYNSSSNPILTEVTFTGNSATIRGGGMYNGSSNPNLTDVTFTGNSSGDVGGGMFNSGSNPILSDVSFTNNSATNSGGGIYSINSASLSLTNVTFVSNTANNGGGMNNQNSSPSLTNVDFSSNSASGNGGGVYNYSGLPSYTQVTFTSNSAGNFGGGIFTDNSSPSFTGGSFKENTAGSRGGGMYNAYNSSPSLTDVNFENNSATYRGGGMYNMDSTHPSLSNIIFKNNSAEEGGGMYNALNCTTDLEEVTFTSNTSVKGAGIYNYVGSSSTLLDVTFTGNSATGIGGGMYSITDTLTTLTDVTFNGNSAVERAGGMYSMHAISAHLENVIFTSNTAGYGGGMENHSTDTGMVNVIFEGNSATYDGGAIYDHHSNTHLINVWIMNNTAAYGAGMYNGWSSNPELEYVTFDSNSATYRGGGMYNIDTSSPLLVNVAFNENSAVEYGGGIYNYTGSLPRLVNVVLYGNSANYYGGGIYNYSSSPTLENVTLGGNVALLGGGAMFSVSKGITLSTPSISNSILWGNTIDQVSADISSTLTISYTDVQGGCPASATCTSVINLDPLFVSAAGGDLRLTLTSPAIDAGSNTLVDSSITTDLLGNPRLRDVPTVPDTGVGPAPIVDMGAYEAGVNQPTAVDDNYSTTENNPVVVSSPGVLSNDSPPSGLTANLSIGPAHGVLTLSANGAFNYTPNTNYSGTDTFAYRANNGTMNSNVATVAITVIPIDDTTTTVNCGSGTPVVTYGSSITCVATVTRLGGSHTPSGTVSWTTNGSGSFVTSPCTLSGSGLTATCSVSYTPSARGSGSHLITATYGGDTYFTGSSGSQTVTVNRRLASVTPNAASKTYGDSDPALTGTLTNFLPADNVTATYSRTSGETVSGSPYIISATLNPTEVLSNYTITYNTANFTINKRSVTVTADTKTKGYGQPDPVFSYQITSGSLAFSDTFSGALTRVAGENVGTYAILQGTLALNANYTLTYIGAGLTITAEYIFLPIIIK